MDRGTLHLGGLSELERDHCIMEALEVITNEIKRLYNPLLKTILFGENFGINVQAREVGRGEVRKTEFGEDELAWIYFSPEDTNRPVFPYLPDLSFNSIWF